MIILGIVVSCLLFSAVMVLFINSMRMYRNVDVYKQMIQAEKDKFVKVNNTLASIRVKHGQTWEVFMPLMDDFEKTLGPKENAVFLGQPIDLVYFNDNEVVFVEVKTGNSRLSTRQRHIRNLIKDRKVRWAEVNDMLKHASRGIDQPSSVDMMKTIPHREPSN